MANSSFSSNVSLSHVLSKECDEAFEELYKRTSPLPTLIKPLFAVRDKLMAPPKAHGQNRVKIKAIFDSMKEKNSSMFSDLSSSFCTSNTSSYDADIVSRPAKDFQRPKEKENKTPPGEDQDVDEVDCPAEITNSPSDCGRPAVPQSPAMRAALNFAQRAAQVDCSSSVTSLSSAGTGLTIQETRRARTVGVMDNTRGGKGEQESCHAGERHGIKRREKIPAPTASGDLVKSRQPDASGDIGTDCWKDAGNMTEEVCLPHTYKPAEETALWSKQTTEGSSEVLSTTVTLESRDWSPVAINKSTSKSPADQETLQLVSKLVQHLQSSAKKRSEVENDKDGEHLRSLPMSSQSKGSCAANNKESSESSEGSESEENTRPRQNRTKNLGKGVNTSVKNSKARNAASDSKKGANKNSDRSAERFIEEDKKRTRRMTLRTRKRGPAVTEASDRDEQARGRAARRERSALRSQRKLSEEEDSSEEVEDDVIAQQVQRPLGDIQDSFSQDVSSEMENEVDEDAIAHAFKNPKTFKPAKQRGTRAISGTEPGGRRFREEEEPDGTTAATGKSKDRILTLSCWSLQPVARLKTVRIEGKLPNTDYFWLSSVVVERVSSRILKTINGSLYQLMGNMASLHTRAAGFSAELTQLFKRGFPEDWKELLESSVSAAELNCKTQLPGTLPTSSKEDQPLNEKEAGNNTRQQKRQSLPRRSKRKAADVRSFHTPVKDLNDMEDSHTIWTPQGVMSRVLGAQEVRRTHSGRCVIPPLARWAGQYLQRDNDGNVTIGFTSMAAEKHFAAIAQHELEAPTRLRNSLARTRIRPVQMGNSRRGSPLYPQRKTADSVAGSKEKMSGRTSSHQAVVKKASRKVGSKEPGGGSILLSDNCGANSKDQEPLSLEEEVMSLVHKSKAKRLQKTTEKRRTCYSNSADVDRQKTNKVGSETFDDPYEADFVSLPNPAQPVITPVSVRLTKLAVSGTVQLKGKGERKQSRPLSQTEPSLKSHQQRGAENNVGKGRDKLELSVSFESDSEEETLTHGRTKSRAGKTCAVGHGGRKKKQTEPDTDVDISDREDCDVDSDSSGSGSMKKVSSTNSCVLTAGVLSRATRRKRELAQITTDKDLEVSNSSSETTIKGRLRRRKNVNYKDTDPASSEDTEEELSEDESSDDENQGRNQRNAQKRSAGRRRFTSSVRDRRKKVQSRAKWAESSQNKHLSSSADQDGSRSWTEEEVDNFHRGMESIKSNHPQFWEAVSRYVGSRSAKECAAFYLKDDEEYGSSHKAKDSTDASRKKAGERKPKQSGKTPVLQAKPGTLKRRQELTAILEHESNNSNNPDDLFQGTPFRTKKIKAAALKTDKEVFGNGFNFLTPMNRQSMLRGCTISHTPASSRKTPSIGIISPWEQTKDSAQKRDLDQYVYRQQKNKRQLTKSYNKKKSEGKDTGVCCPASVRLFDQAPVAEDLFKITEEPAEDDEEEEDYYYSEEEN